MDPKSFQDLLAGVRSGDQEAATKLFRHYEKEIRRLIRVKMTDPNLRRVVDFSDIFQSVMRVFFVKLVARVYDFAEPEELLKLLITMAQHKVQDNARKPVVRRMRSAEDGVLDDIHDRPDSSSAFDSVEMLLTKVKQRMTTDEIAVMESRIAGQSWAEIASASGITADAARKRLDRTLERVCQDLEPEGANDG